MQQDENQLTSDFSEQELDQPDTLAQVVQQVGPPVPLSAEPPADEDHDVAPGPNASLPLPKSARGRPLKLDKQQCEKVLLLLSVGLNRRQAAAYAGVHPSALSKAARRDPHFADEMERAELLFEADLSLRLLRAGRRSWRAANSLLHSRRSFASRVANGREDMALLNLQMKHRNDEDPYDDGDDEPEPPPVQYHSCAPRKRRKNRRRNRKRKNSHGEAPPIQCRDDLVKNWAQQRVRQEAEKLPSKERVERILAERRRAESEPTDGA